MCWAELTRAVEIAAKGGFARKVFRRTINDYAANTEDASLRKYIDMLGDNIDADSQSRATEFYDRLKAGLAKDMVAEYSVDWLPRKGLEFESVRCLRGCL